MQSLHRTRLVTQARALSRHEPHTERAAPRLPALTRSYAVHRRHSLCLDYACAPCLSWQVSHVQEDTQRPRTGDANDYFLRLVWGMGVPALWLVITLSLRTAHCARAAVLQPETQADHLPLLVREVALHQLAPVCAQHRIHRAVL